jgi:hypothetical protein
MLLVKFDFDGVTLLIGWESTAHTSDLEGKKVTGVG